MPPTVVYAYGVIARPVRPTAARAPAGLPGATRPRVVPIRRSLWCVVADVPLARYRPDRVDAGLRDLEWVSRMAMAHEKVVEHFARMRGTTVIPLKLFTMFSSAERAVEVMRARHLELIAIARHIRGCEEWGLRVTRGSAIRPSACRTNRPRSGAAFLVAKKQARDDARAAAWEAIQAAENAYRMLTPVAKDTRRRNDVPAGAVAPPLLDAVFLVPSVRKRRFESLVSRAAEQCRSVGADLTLTGPWPAYNFAAIEEPPA